MKPVNLTPLTKTEAERLHKRIESTVSVTAADLLTMRDRRGWEALGYSSFEDYCINGLKSSRKRIMGILAIENVKQTTGITLPVEAATIVSGMTPQAQAEVAPGVAEAAKKKGAKGAKAAAKKAVSGKTVAKPRQVGEAEVQFRSAIRKACNNPNIDFTNIPKKDVEAWAMHPEPKAIYKVMKARVCRPGQAIEFLTKMPDGNTTVAALNLLADAMGPQVIEIAGIVTISYKRDEFRKFHQQAIRELGA